MPRKGRGGARQGTPGTAYGNRTDLNEPITTVPNQAYGKAAAQRAAQQAVPMGASPVASAPAAPMSVEPNRPAPGTMPYLDATERPNEPVTTGMPFGPGAGPEALGGRPQPRLSDQLAATANTNSSSFLLGLLANTRQMGL
jgi:hypothetical protein